MTLTFRACDPRYMDGSFAASFSLTSQEQQQQHASAPQLVIWRLTRQPQSSISLNPPSSQLVSDETVLSALDILFPQLSSSAKKGPSLTRIEECLANPATFTLFLATEVTADLEISRVVGCLTLITLNLLMNSRAHIEDLVVLNDYRGKGLGRGLMQRALTEAVESHHCSMVDLTSKPDRVQARALYESLGFQLRDTGAFRFYAPKK
ncbi:hypothetical protein BGZ83_006338 [Gryganskiella cystojenkinii]|nr:hypothetical protein BGZ83_006338 [Gryganskiella cystojenkinii]